MRDRTGIMLATPYEESRVRTSTRKRLRWTWPCHIQPKLDGIRARIVATPQSADPDFQAIAHTAMNMEILSATALPLPAVAHMAVQASEWEFFVSIAKLGMELDGELYVHGWPLERIEAAAMRNEPTDDSLRLEYHIFDVKAALTSKNRQLLLDMLFTSSGVPQFARRVLTQQVFSLEEIYSKEAEFTEMGYEGFILRHFNLLYEERRSLGMLKFKPKRDDVYRVIAAREAVGELGNPLGMLGALTVTDAEGNMFDVGAGRLSQQARYELWRQRENLPGQYVRVQYQCFTRKGIPRHGIVVEILPCSINERGERERI